MSIPHPTKPSSDWCCKHCQRRLGDIYGTAVHIGIGARDIWVIGGTVIQKCGQCGHTSCVTFTDLPARVIVEATEGDLATLQTNGQVAPRG